MKRFFIAMVIVLTGVLSLSAAAHDPERLLNTTGGGSKWEVQYSGTSISLNSVHFIDTDHGWCVGGGGVILKTEDAGKSWTFLTSGTNEDLNGVWFLDKDRGYAVGNNGTMIATLNGGGKWMSCGVGTTKHLRAVAFTESGYGTVVGDSATIFTTKDYGAIWKNKSGGISENLLAVAFGSEDNGFIVGEHGVMLRRVNGTDSWPQLQLETPPTRVKMRTVTMPEENLVIMAGDNGLVYRSTDNGLNWVRLIPNTTKAITGICFTDVHNGILVGDGGIVYHTTCSGWMWNSEASNTTTQLSAVCFPDVQCGYIVGTGGMILHMTSNATGVDDATQPGALTLAQNYPNPFNSSTGISYTLQQREQATLTVYNVLGQPVSVLVDGLVEAGSHNVTFNGANLQPGVYFCELRAGGSMSRIRMVLNK